jgi:hypothetical protein
VRFAAANRCAVRAAAVAAAAVAIRVSIRYRVIRIFIIIVIIHTIFIIVSFGLCCVVSRCLPASARVVATRCRRSPIAARN